MLGKAQRLHDFNYGTLLSEFYRTRELPVSYQFKARGDISWLKYMAIDAFRTESQCREYMYRSVSLIIGTQ